MGIAFAREWRAVRQLTLGIGAIAAKQARINTDFHRKKI
jgi:hypothetical protein